MLDNIKRFVKLIFGIRLSDKELKKVIRFVVASKSQKLFEYLLKNHDPSLDLSYSNYFENKSFLDQGRGNGTVKPYRVLENSNSKVFEKIFFNHSKHLTSAICFDEHQERLLEDKDIKSPPLIDVIKGERLTVLLYEFWDLNKLQEKSAYKVLKSKTMELCKDMYPVSPNEQSTYSDDATAGKEIYNPKPDLFSEEFSKIEKIAKDFPIYFQHLDLSYENVFENDVIIDWDNSGYYILGVDFGMLLLSYYILNPSIFLSTYKSQIIDYYSNINSGISFEEFQLVVLFYFLILFHGHHKTENSVKNITTLINAFREDLKEYCVNCQDVIECDLC